MIENAGIKEENLDRSVKPGQDFYRFSCGGWLRSNPLPDDFSSYGTYDELAELNRRQLKDLIDGKPLNTARTLLGAGLVRAPEVFAHAGHSARKCNLLQHDVVAVPDERVRLYRSPCRAIVRLYDLLHAAVPMVVAVQHRKRSDNRRKRIGGDQPVLRIIGIGENAVVGQVPVGIIDEVCAAGDGCVLVEAVRRVGIRRCVFRRPEAIPDGVIGVAVKIGADRGSGEFRALVVQPLPLERDGIRRVCRAAEKIVLRRVPERRLSPEDVVSPNHLSFPLMTDCTHRDIPSGDCGIVLSLLYKTSSHLGRKTSFAVETSSKHINWPVC